MACALLFFDNLNINITNTKMKTYSLLYACAFALLAAGCSQERTVNITGQVANANGEKLYLEHLGAGRPEVIDSAVLDAKGHFKFKVLTEDGPDFFSLRLVTQSIPLATDTLQSPIEVNTSLRNFASGYEVKDDLNRRLKEAAQAGNELRRNVMDCSQRLNDGLLTREAYRDTLRALVDGYKQDMLQTYIYQNPSDPVSYYVLFQSVRGLSIFDPYDARDNRAFGAVATGWVFNYPKSPRCKYLEQVTREGQALRVRERMEAERADSITRNIQVANFFNLILPDKNDKPVDLSSLVDGKSIILLDFTAYYLPVSVGHNRLLQQMWEKYHDRGLKIYQVCMDPDENFWKVSADNVPWTAVRDTEVLFDTEGNIRYSRAAATYNVTHLPSLFLLDRDGSLNARIEHEDKLDGVIAAKL